MPAGSMSLFAATFIRSKALLPEPEGSPATSHLRDPGATASPSSALGSAGTLRGSVLTRMVLLTSETFPVMQAGWQYRI